MANKYIKGLVEKLTMLADDWIIFQPDAEEKVAYKIKQSNLPAVNDTTKLSKTETADQSVESNLLGKKQITVQGKVLAFTVTPTFDLTNMVQVMEVTGDVTSITISNALQSGEYYIYLTQDNTGGHTIADPDESFGRRVDGSAASYATQKNDVNIFKITVDPGGNNFYELKTAAAAAIPLPAEALFWLDGTIIDVSGTYYLEDQSGNNRDFLIANHDFESTWNTGFPFKSAATISAPAGDATLISGDINNFLYDSGGSPNQIPVVSFFENIDYENKLFCRNVDALINGNGVETQGGYVTDIVLYDSVLSGSDLISAIAYYSVPVEDAGASWVTAGGNDTTGDGSKLTPWLTAQKGATSVNDGSQIYLKTQLYDDEGGGYLYNLNNNALNAVGRALFDNADATYGIRTADDDPDKFSRLYINSNAPDFPMFLASPNLENESIYINTNACQRLVFGTWKSFKNSIFVGSPSIAALESTSNTSADITVEGCLLMATSGKQINLNSGDYLNVKILNNHVRGSSLATIIFIHLTTGSVLIRGNKIQPSSSPTGSSVDISCGGEISHNEITADNGRLINAVGSDIIDISYNTLYINDANTVNEAINAPNRPVIANSNIITSSSTTIANFADIRMTQNTAGVISQVVANNNKILVNRQGEYHIEIGREETTAGDNSVSSIEVQKNFIKGAGYYGGSLGVTHGVFVGFQINAQMRYNYEIGIQYGYVIKGSTGTVYTQNGCSYNIIQECLRCVLLKGTQSVYVTNNTIVNRTLDLEWGVDLNYNIAIGTDPADNCVVKNNIIISLGTGINYMINRISGTNNDIDHNLYYCPNGTPLWGGVDWATWQGQGNDLNSKILTDIEFGNLFTDFDNNDFSLAAGSEAIGFGENLGINYNQGLDSTTDWKAENDNELQTIVLKNQPASWDAGAYISE